jgi:hypothetical protein
MYRQSNLRVGPDLVLIGREVKLKLHECSEAKDKSLAIPHTGFQA